MVAACWGVNSDARVDPDRAVGFGYVAASRCGDGLPLTREPSGPMPVQTKAARRGDLQARPARTPPASLYCVELWSGDLERKLSMMTSGQRSPRRPASDVISPDGSGRAGT